MENKFNMTQEDNINFAKRKLIDAIYKSANLEGIAVTFADTTMILHDKNIEKLKPSEIGKICCLRDAWRYILEEINKPLHLGVIEQVHSEVARRDVPYYELGRLRRNSVRIGGTNWRPEIPDTEELHSQLMRILKIENNTDRALTTFLWIMKSQMFTDGNKRVANIICNKILIQGGNGILSIPVEFDDAFKKKLIGYYEDDKQKEEFKNWLYRYCIEGIREKKQEIVH